MAASRSLILGLPIQSDSACTHRYVSSAQTIGTTIGFRTFSYRSDHTHFRIPINVNLILIALVLYFVQYETQTEF